jgi:hypothetical protein
VIDFRYHLVSIVAVFLALAIGIVLGSTELQGTTIDALRSSSNLLKSQLTTAEGQRDAYQGQESASEKFLQAAELQLIGGTLAGDSIVIVTEPGAPGSVVDGVKQAAGVAGATVAGQVALQPKFYDVSGANLSSLGGINSQVADNTGAVLDATANPQTQYQQNAAQLIASAILEKTAGVDLLTEASAQSLLGAYAQGGYLSVSGTPRGTLAVIVSPQAAPAAGANDPANQVLLAVAQEFANASAATLVAGSTTGSAQPGSAMSALRSSSASGAVSSVDNADTTLGQVLVMEALAAQLAGQKPNSYGISGASSVSPVQVPSSSPPATAPPTVSQTTHPTPTGKATKPVRKK